jgi:riboflavin kinase/FMN adenylyltransferase
LAIGNFDGVHVGHQHIFALARQKAHARGGQAGVLTFDPHPAKVLAPDVAPPLICPLERRLELIAACGIDLVVVEPFDRALAALSPEAFMGDVLCGALGARDIVVGPDFTFGRGRAGTVDTLRTAGAACGFSVTVAPQVTASGLVASSSKIRELVLEGRVGGAARLLGRNFELSGEVVRGAGRGRSIGIPTANVQTKNELLPRGGVYAGYVRIDQERSQAAINVGTNPTFTRGDALSIEAHLLDWQGDLYGRTVTVELVERLRPEQRFSDAAELVAQIRRDILSARELLKSPKRGEHG